jgi:hypothetical protein
MSVVARSASRRGRAYMTRRDDFFRSRARARRRATRVVVCGPLFPLARSAESLGTGDESISLSRDSSKSNRREEFARRVDTRRRARSTRCARDARRRRTTRASDARDDASTPETSAKRDARYEYEIALGSSGWLFVYYVGVVKAMRERGMARCALKMFARCARGSERDGAREGGSVA